MNCILQDIRFGIRTLGRAPGFTAVVVFVLALGIGANSAIFTVLNAVLFRSLPYPDSDRLVMLWETNPRFQIGSETLPVTAGDFVDWKEQNDVFEHISAFGARRLVTSRRYELRESIRWWRCVASEVGVSGSEFRVFRVQGSSFSLLIECSNAQTSS